MEREREGKRDAQVPANTGKGLTLFPYYKFAK